jgi:transcriptional regulator with XRE-family HTH domain
MVNEIFSKVLRELREENHYSQEHLAEIADLSTNYISYLERGLRQPSITTVFKLAKALDIKPSQLIERVENQVK